MDSEKKKQHRNIFKLLRLLSHFLFSLLFTPPCCCSPATIRNVSPNHFGKLVRDSGSSSPSPPLKASTLIRLIITSSTVLIAITIVITIIIVPALTGMYLLKVAVASDAYRVRRPVPPPDAPAVRRLPHAR